MKRFTIFVLIALPVTIAFWLGVEYVLTAKGIENMFAIVWTLWLAWFGGLSLIYKKFVSNGKSK